MGVPYNDPNTPPLELSMNPISNLTYLFQTQHTHMVNDPPAISSSVNLLSLAYRSQKKNVNVS
jgi:hypothetical protein